MTFSKVDKTSRRKEPSQNASQELVKLTRSICAREHDNKIALQSAYLLKIKSSDISALTQVPKLNKVVEVLQDRGIPMSALTRANYYLKSSSEVLFRFHHEDMGRFSEILLTLDGDIEAAMAQPIEVLSSYTPSEAYPLIISLYGVIWTVETAEFTAEVQSWNMVFVSATVELNPSGLNDGGIRLIAYPIEGCKPDLPKFTFLGGRKVKLNPKNYCDICFMVGHTVETCKETLEAKVVVEEARASKRKEKKKAKTLKNTLVEGPADSEMIVGDASEEMDFNMEEYDQQHPALKADKKSKKKQKIDANRN